MSLQSEPRLRVLWRAEGDEDDVRVLHERVARERSLDVRVAREGDEQLRDANWPQILVAGRADSRLLDGAALQRVVVPWAGIPERLRQEVLARPHLKLHNSHFNAPFVAQHAVALLLACSNRIIPGHLALREGEWGRQPGKDLPSLHLEGENALLMGYGAIGRGIATRLRGLGMNIGIYRRHPDPGEPHQFGPEELRDALAWARVVMLSLPVTPETEGLLDEDAISALPRGSILVNVGRGPTVDQWALYRALAEGRLGGAGLDVWWNYPPRDEPASRARPADPPFEELDNVVMSPHRADRTANWRLAAAEDVLETLNALVRGQERYLVDATLGY